MRFWNKLFAREGAPVVPPTVAASMASIDNDKDSSLPPPPPPAVETPPLFEPSVGSLAELFLRSYLILTGQTQGSRLQAQAFDDWLESYRGEVHKVLARAALHPGRAEAEVRIPGGAVFWWEISDPEIRFLCSYSGLSGYLIPRDADPVPLISDFKPPDTPLARIVSVQAGFSPAPARPPRRMELLREKLRNENIMVRMQAVTELEESGSADALPGVREAMRNDHIAVRIQAGYALGRLTETIAPAWAKPFQGGPVQAQVKAVRKLDQLAVLHAAAIPEQVEVVLTDEHLAAITYAVTGLCMIGQKAVLASYLSAEVLRAGGETDLVEQIDRLNAAGVAGMLGLEAALACPVPTARLDVENTLKSISGCRDMLLRLGWILHPKQGGADNNPPPTDLEEVAQTVRELSSPRADLRSSYALWLALRDPVVVAPHVRRLAELLTDREAEVRESAALALGALGRFAALGVLRLREAFADPCPNVRRRVAWALGAIGPAAGLAVPALSAANADPNPDVREAAHEAVRRIGTTFAS